MYGKIGRHYPNPIVGFEGRRQSKVRSFVSALVHIHTGLNVLSHELVNDRLLVLDHTFQVSHLFIHGVYLITEGHDLPLDAHPLVVRSPVGVVYKPVGLFVPCPPMRQMEGIHSLVVAGMNEFISEVDVAI